jgi:signal transduction histidine kinase
MNPNPDELYRHYRELQLYVGWTEEDARRVHSVAGLLDAHLPLLIEDFYAEIDRHPEARRVITGGLEQIQRLKGTLLRWIRELMSGPYDSIYALRRWQVGRRHVEIGLDQVYTNVALSRLRRGLMGALQEAWTGDPAELRSVVRSLNTLFDLDLALIEDAYQAEYASRLQRYERLVAIGQVAGGIAHELRNPLNVIKTSVYYLLNAKNASPEKQQEHLQRIERHVVLSDGVITALSNFAKLPVPNLRPFPIRPCVVGAVESSALPEQIAVTINLDDALPPALADEDQVRIVFANIFRNAKEAMPSGGRLDVHGVLEGDSLEVAVTDTGIGISPENLKRVTEPLFSTKARGLGLGLAISRAILDKNKGQLRVHSQPGQGSTFVVRLTAAPV